LETQLLLLKAVTISASQELILQLQTYILLLACLLAFTPQNQPTILAHNIYDAVPTVHRSSYNGISVQERSETARGKRLPFGTECWCRELGARTSKPQPSLNSKETLGGSSAHTDLTSTGIQGLPELPDVAFDLIWRYVFAPSVGENGFISCAGTSASHWSSIPQILIFRGDLSILDSCRYIRRHCIPIIF
jgi:hypothetical protein